MVIYDEKQKQNLSDSQDGLIVTGVFQKFSSRLFEGNLESISL